MLLNKIPPANPGKPQPVVLRHPKPVAHALERQLLNKKPATTLEHGKKSTKNTQCLVGVEQHSTKTPIASACSNKHVIDSNLTNNQSATSTSVLIPESKQQMQEKSVNTNLITEAIAALTCKNLEHPSVSKGFCDRLTITFGDRTLDTECFAMATHDLRRKTTDAPYLAISKVDKSPYMMNFSVKSSKGKKLALFQIKGKTAKMRFARLDFNPAAIGLDGVREIRQLLAMLFGDDYCNILGQGRITRLDASLDVIGQHVKDLIAYTTHPQQNTLFMKVFPKNGAESWILGTLYFGAKKSGRRFMLYDKARQLFEVKGIYPSQSHTRIELKYLADKCGCSAEVKDVFSVRNPLSRLKLAYFPCQQNMDLSLELFLLGVREWGLNPALSKIGDKNKRSAMRRVISKQSSEWWQPERIWKEVLGHLESLSLFPKGLFPSGA